VQYVARLLHSSKELKVPNVAVVLVSRHASLWQLQRSGMLQALVQVTIEDAEAAAVMFELLEEIAQVFAGSWQDQTGYCLR
jgi:hypothetical protein